jgi:hypothetical protein
VPVVVYDQQGVFLLEAAFQNYRQTKASAH